MQTPVGIALHLSSRAAWLMVAISCMSTQCYSTSSGGLLRDSPNSRDKDHKGPPLAISLHIPTMFINLNPYNWHHSAHCPWALVPHSTSVLSLRAIKSKLVRNDFSIFTAWYPQKSHNLAPKASIWRCWLESHDASHIVHHAAKRVTQIAVDSWQRKGLITTLRPWRRESGSVTRCPALLSVLGFAILTVTCWLSSR
eukprot:scaffold89605_cov25-Prasinocladus_malaysianus.AAC.2